MISHLIRVYKRDGLLLFIIRVIAKILHLDLVKIAKNKAWKIIKEKHNNIVAYGPFKGMNLGNDFWRSKNDQISQILGIYEEHVLEKLCYFSAQGSTRFINVGAADGYFSVGMAYSKIYSQVYALDIDPKAQNNIKENAKKNLCLDLVNVFGEANLATVASLVSKEAKATVLIDIEGDEYEFLSEEMLSLLSNSYLICELHPWLKENGENLQKDLMDRASKKFNIDLIIRENYAPNRFSEFDNLTDEERLIAVSEGREKNMQWLVLVPK